TLTNCAFIGNQGNAAGGGITNYGPVTLTNCTFSGNQAPSGAGMINYGGATLISCAFTGNTASGAGGGIVNYDPATLTNCIFSGNNAQYGGGIAIYDPTTLINCTFSGNHGTVGGGIFNTVEATALTNCILWDNNTQILGTSLIANYSIVQGGYSGTANKDKDPLFADPANHDYHLTACSPAIDAGTNGGAPDDDLDGSPRPFPGTDVDMGAYEFQGAATPLVTNCQNCTVYLNAAGVATLPASQLDNGSTGCGTLTFGVNDQSEATFGCAQLGPNTVILTVTDSRGTATCTATVTVVDNIIPTISCPNPVTVTCSGNVPTVNLASVTVSDNCGTPAKSHVGDAISNQTCVNRKTVTRTYRATDGSGNSTICVQIITVFDDVKPNFSSVPANITMQCNSVPAVGSATASDGCGGSVTIAFNGQTTMPGACPDSYTITRQWTATDACGNTRTATQCITVTDTQKPNFVNTPANITVQCSAIPGENMPTATDNCDATVAITYNGQTQSAGTCPNAYTLTRSWTAADNCGNTRSISQRITVVDTGKPVFTSFPNNTSITCTENPPAVGNPTASDGCAGNVTVTYLGQTTTSGTCPGNYQIKRTWRATDVCGNSTAATQTIQISDTGAPVFTSVPGPVTIECNTPLPPLVNPTASDACGGYTQITFLGNVATGSGCAANYTITRTWRATDLCGNSVTTMQVITVQGNNYSEEGAENREDGTQIETRNRLPANALTEAGKLITVYPNPTTDRVWIDLADFAEEAVTVSIFSDLGQLVWERRLPIVEELKLSVSLREAGAAAGGYTVSVRSASGVVAKRVLLVE
ncbi:MAG: choice-of-anchor Q domain-containing protein, partial [Saprospiraceae bacterium]